LHLRARHKTKRIVFWITTNKAMMATQIAQRSGNLEPQMLQMGKRDLGTTERIIYSLTQRL